MAFIVRRVYTFLNIFMDVMLRFCQYRNPELGHVLHTGPLMRPFIGAMSKFYPMHKFVSGKMIVLETCVVVK